MEITMKTLIRDLLNDPLFSDHLEFLLYFYDLRGQEDRPFGEFLLERDHEIKCNDVIYRFDRFHKLLSEGSCFYRFDETRPFTGLFYIKSTKPYCKGKLITIPGGGYGSVCGRNEGLGVAFKLADEGYDVFILKYGVKEYARFPEATSDLVHALEYLLANPQYFGDCHDYTLLGYSASAHLVGTFVSSKYGYKNYGLPGPNGIVLGYPVVTFSGPTNGHTRDNCLGQDRLNDMELRKELSLENLVDDNFPRSFIAIGGKDNIVPSNNGKALKEALDKFQRPYIYKVYEDCGHGFAWGTGTSSNDWILEALAFVRK